MDVLLAVACILAAMGAFLAIVYFIYRKVLLDIWEDIW